MTREYRESGPGYNLPYDNKTQRLKEDTKDYQE